MSDMSEIESRVKKPAHAASRELRYVIENLIDGSVVPAEGTLGELRKVLIAGGIFVSDEGEFLYPQDRTFLVIELDELIDRYGIEARAHELT